MNKAIIECFILDSITGWVEGDWIDIIIIIESHVVDQMNDLMLNIEIYQWLMNQKKHEKIHALFHNATPQEQLIECLDWNKKVINPIIYEMLFEILNSEKEVFYKKELVK